MKRQSYDNENDFLLMQNLIRENYRNNDVQLYPSPSNLDYWRYIDNESHEEIKNVQLWFDDQDQLRAFAWINDDIVDFVCHYQYKDILSDIIDWTECVKLENTNQYIMNCFYLFDCDKESEVIAQSKGYKKSKIFKYYGLRSLEKEISQLSLPFRFQIKSIETEEEIVQRAKLNGLVGKEVTPEQYQYFMKHAINYRQDLDLIVVDPLGKVAGFCTCWYDAMCQVGMFEAYAVDYAYLRRGLGRNLLYEGMRRLLALGCHSVYVSHSGLTIGDSDSSLALNENVGFRQVRNQYMWTKRLNSDL